MAWLLRDGQVLASLEIADTFLSRNRGLLGRSGTAGAMLLTHTRGVHSVGMRFAIDVAFLDKGLVVVDTVTLRRHWMALSSSPHPLGARGRGRGLRAMGPQSG